MNNNGNLNDSERTLGTPIGSNLVRIAVHLVVFWLLVYFLFAPGKLFTVDSLTAAATARQILHGQLHTEKGMLTLSGRGGQEYFRHALLWSLLLVPFDVVAMGLEHLLPESVQAEVFPGGVTAVVLPCANHLTTALLLGFLFCFLVRLGAGPRSALVVACTAAISTMLLPYSRDLFRQPLQGLLFLAAIAFLWDMREGKVRSRALLAGISLALAILNRYATFAFLPVFAVGFLFRLRRIKPKPEQLKAFLAFAIPIAAGLVLHGFTMWLRFENPFYYPFQDQGYNRSLLETIPYYLLSLEGGNLGYCPLWIFLIWGIPALWKRGEKWLALIIPAITLTAFLLYGQYELFYGGQNPGPRYMLPLIPLWFVSLGVLYDQERCKTVFIVSWIVFAGFGVAVNGYEAITDYTEYRTAGLILTNAVLPGMDDGLPPWEPSHIFVGLWPRWLSNETTRVPALLALTLLLVGAAYNLRAALRLSRQGRAEPGNSRG